MSNDHRKMAYSRPDGSRADIPRPQSAPIMGYDKGRPITGKMTYIPGPCPHRPRPQSSFAGLPEMFDAPPERPSRAQSRFAGIVGDEAPAPMKPLQPLKPRQFTPSTKPKDLIVMDVNDDLPARRGVPGAATPAARVGRDEETSPQDDLCNKVYFYLEKAGAKEQDLEDFLSLWERVHKLEGQAMDRRSTRRAPRPMSASERTAFNTRFPHAGRLG